MTLASAYVLCHLVAISDLKTELLMLEETKCVAMLIIKLSSTVYLPVLNSLEIRNQSRDSIRLLETSPL